MEVRYDLESEKRLYNIVNSAGDTDTQKLLLL